MKEIIKLLDRAKSLNPNNSDYRTAKLINVNPTAVYAWRAGSRLPTQNQVIALAKIANESPGYWLMMLEAEKAKDDNLSRVWKELAAANT